MEHEGHAHHHTHRANKKTLTLSLVIITAYMLIEVVGGLLTNSLALLADAGHMLSDAVSLFIALMAFRFSNRKANYDKTYGYKRFEILAAVFNGVTLILISVYILYEAIIRLRYPTEIASQGMLVIAFIGLLVNALVAYIMFRQSDVKGNLNMRGAYLHVISDMLGSVGAISAALLILLFGWTWADPLASIAVSILVLRSGYIITKSAVHVLMEGTPSTVDMSAVTDLILHTEGVKGVHDLHVWTITSGLNALTCHAVVADNMTIQESERLVSAIERGLETLDIHHVTIQIETSAHLHDNSLLCMVDKSNTRST